METDVENLVCENCNNASMTFMDGLLICSVCGHQSQEQQEEDGEGFEAQANTKFKRRITFIKGKAKERLTLEGKLPGITETVQGYLTILQDTIMALGKFLGEQFNVGDAMLPTLRKIWLAKVAMSNVLSKKFLTDSKYATTDPETDSDKVYIWLKKEFNNALLAHLAPDMILELLFLALFYLRAPITPMYLAGTSWSGELPFFAEIRNACEEHDAESDYKWLPILRRRTGIASAAHIFLGAGSLASQIKLKLPPLNSAALVELFCRDLELPSVWQKFYQTF